MNEFFIRKPQLLTKSRKKDGCNYDLHKSLDSIFTICLYFFCEICICNRPLLLLHDFSFHLQRLKHIPKISIMSNIFHFFVAKPLSFFQTDFLFPIPIDIFHACI